MKKQSKLIKALIELAQDMHEVAVLDEKSFENLEKIIMRHQKEKLPINKKTTNQ